MLWRRRSTLILLTLLFGGIFALTFHVQPAEAVGTIYIRADGSIDPPTANITSADNVTYTFTDNNYDSIVMERDNIVVDGAGFTVHGAGGGGGVTVAERQNVTLTNIEVTNFGGGIIIFQSNHTTLANNTVFSNVGGIGLDLSHYNALIGNNVSANDNGIYLFASNYNTLAKNIVSSNHRYGIEVEASGDNTLAYNNASFNMIGINVYLYVDFASSTSLFSISGNNTLIGNIVSNNEHGINFYYSGNNRIVDNTVSNNNQYGIAFASSGENLIANNIVSFNDCGIKFLGAGDSTVCGNTICNNNYGIWLDSSDNVTVFGNTLSDNYYGICLYYYSSINSVFHNNFVNNTFQTKLDDTIGKSNSWDDGYPSGGNYWSNHICTGNPSDGTQPYIINANNTDHYPFQDPNGWAVQGDINDDGTVDILDAIILANAFGSKPGDSNWNPNADLNGDSTVDILDAIILANDFGRQTR